MLESIASDICSLVNYMSFKISGEYAYCLTYGEPFFFICASFDPVRRLK